MVKAMHARPSGKITFLLQLGMQPVLSKILRSLITVNSLNSWRQSEFKIGQELNLSSSQIFT